MGCGVVGYTWRELAWMADANAKAWRERLVALAMLVWGKMGDVGAFIADGRVTGPTPKESPAITPEVSRYMRAIQKAGRFVMPEDVDKILGPEDGENQTQDDGNASRTNG